MHGCATLPLLERTGVARGAALGTLTDDPIDLNVIDLDIDGGKGSLELDAAGFVWGAA